MVLRFSSRSTLDRTITVAPSRCPRRRPCGASGVLPTLWVSVGFMALAALPVLLSPLVRMRDLPGAPEMA